MTQEQGFFEKHAKKLTAVAALALGVAAYQGAKEDTSASKERVAAGALKDLPPDAFKGLGVGRGTLDWGQYIEPRENIPLEAFSAADEFIERYGITEDISNGAEAADQRDPAMKEIAKRHGVSDIDMVQAFRWRTLDAQGK
jgi:hypothetical protein